MTIDTLLSAVPPPAAPFQAFTGPWEPVEAYLGTRLPQDYKDFSRLYGRPTPRQGGGRRAPSFGLAPRD